MMCKYMKITYIFFLHEIGKHEERGDAAHSQKSYLFVICPSNKAICNNDERCIFGCTSQKMRTISDNDFEYLFLIYDDYSVYS